MRPPPAGIRQGVKTQREMKTYYKYTITVESEDWMHPEVIEEDLGEVFDPFGLDHKLKGIVTHIKREKMETK